MEDLIVGLLFVYAFIIRPILKQFRNRTPEAQEEGEPPAAEPRSPEGSLLEKLKEKLREAAETVRNEEFGEGTPPPWKEWLGEPEPEAESWEPPQEVKKPVREPIPSAPAKPVQEEPAPVMVEPPARRPYALPADLRRAVVWSEILAPPVSLRDSD